MEVKIINEAGYEAALFGLGLSHGVTSGMNPENFQYIVVPENADAEWWSKDHFPDEFYKMQKVAKRLAGKGNGHDKFLRQIIVWLDCVCPRYFWPELDQYKVATVTQSESTMHTITKKEFTVDDFEFDNDTYLHPILTDLNGLREDYLSMKTKEKWKTLIQLLPQSYLQRRILTCSYATLRAIIEQRRGHKLSEWQVFIDAVREQAQHPELLP